MVKNNYGIEYLPSFNEELSEILYYITYKLKNKKASERLLKNVEAAIINRSINPEAFEIYKSIKNRKHKWYRIYVGNFIIFYIVTNNTMIVAHILYSKRDIENFIY